MYESDPVGIARTLDITVPNTTSQRIGWTARVAISIGSRRTLRSSLRAIEMVSMAKRRRAGGSAQAAGRSARSSDVTIRSSSVDGGPGRGPEDVVERRPRADLELEVGRRADRRDRAVMHHSDPIAQCVGLVHV